MVEDDDEREREWGEGYAEKEVEEDTDEREQEDGEEKTEKEIEDHDERDRERARRNWKRKQKITM